MSYLLIRLLPVLAIALAACASETAGSAQLWSGHGRPTQGAAGPILDQLTAQVPDAAQIDVFYAEFDVPYGQVFGATVKVLREQGDSVRLVDGDVGYIATDPSQHWPTFRDSYSLQYLIAFEKVSTGRTRMIFKVLQWDLAFDPTDNLQRSPLGSALVADFTTQRENANAFASRVRKRVQQG